MTLLWQVTSSRITSSSTSLQVPMLITGLYICLAVQVTLFASASCASLFPFPAAGMSLSARMLLVGTGEQKVWQQNL